jgi:hypothetical protein
MISRNMQSSIKFLCLENGKVCETDNWRNMKSEFGLKAINSGLASELGLHVPKGLALSCSLLCSMLKAKITEGDNNCLINYFHELRESNNKEIQVHIEALIIDQIRQKLAEHHLSFPLAVRSSCSLEDGALTSLAGLTKILYRCRL